MCTMKKLHWHIYLLWKTIQENIYEIIIGFPGVSASDFPCKVAVFLVLTAGSFPWFLSSPYIYIIYISTLSTHLPRFPRRVSSVSPRPGPIVLLTPDWARCPGGLLQPPPSSAPPYPPLYPAWTRPVSRDTLSSLLSTLQYSEEQGVLSILEPQTIVKRRFPKISQSRRRPILGPSPGWKWLLVLLFHI